MPSISYNVIMAKEKGTFTPYAVPCIDLLCRLAPHGTAAQRTTCGVNEP